MIHNVYKMYDAEGALLYIGYTGGLGARVQIHASSSDWFSQVARIDLLTFDTKPEALSAEARLIKDEGPLHNVMRPHVKHPLHKDLTLDDIAMRIWHTGAFHRKGKLGFIRSVLVNPNLTADDVEGAYGRPLNNKEPF